MKRIFRGLLYTAGPLYYIHLYHYSIGFIQGDSMSPTFNPERDLRTRDIVLLQKAPADIEPGNIVFLRHPNDRHRLLVKRVIAVSGQVVQPRTTTTRHPSIYENYAGWLTIPEGACWVEGDEPFVGIDSNQFGPIPIGLVESRVIALLHPFDRISWINSIIPDSSRVR